MLLYSCFHFRLVQHQSQSKMDSKPPRNYNEDLVNMISDLKKRKVRRISLRSLTYTLLLCTYLLSISSSCLPLPHIFLIRTLSAERLRWNRGSELAILLHYRVDLKVYCRTWVPAEWIDARVLHREVEASFTVGCRCIHSSFLSSCQLSVINYS